MVTRVHLLGDARVLHGGAVHRPPFDKRFFLLCYLACASAPVTRERLAFLFWPDVESERARTNLRRLLARSKALAFASGLVADVDRVGWPVASDVAEFRAAVEAREWRRAADAYRGELLAGITADHSPEFDAWLGLERADLHDAWLAATLALAEELAAARRPEEAIAALDRALRSEPDPPEELVLAYLRIASGAGQVEAALRRYHAHAERLEREHGLAPLPETAAAAAALRTALDTNARAYSETRQPPPVLGLPAFQTPFVGREGETSEVLAALAAPDCRLLTLKGPGGIGKTRLAARVATAAASRYTHGAAFVGLAGARDLDEAIEAIAGVLEVPPVGSAAPLERLKTWLGDRQLLLVLDNLEHLVDTATVLSGLLAACPEVKLLVTSRRRLRLAGEWLLEVGGMTLDLDAASGGLEYQDAVRLFTLTLRRFRRDLRLSREELAAVAAVCGQVGGSPLGIELAASLARLLPLDQLADVVARDLDALSAPLQDVAGERRSLRAVFERSWKLLAPAERSALAALSVFRGAFGREAAEEVAGASLRALLGLLDASLLKRRAADRYELHELVRQYAAERLDEGAETELKDRHMGYYAKLLARLEGPVQGGSGQVAALETVAAEIEDVWAAWDWAVGRRDAAALDSLVECVWRYCEIHGRFERGEAALSRAADSVPPGTRAEARVLARLGALAHRLMHLELSELVSERSMVVSRQLGLPPELTALINVAVVPYLRGDLETAVRRHEEALDVAERLDDPLYMAAALINLSQFALADGRYAEAESLTRRALELERRLEDKWSLAFVLSNLGVIRLKSGSPAEAVALFGEALEVSRSIRFSLMAGHVLSYQAEAHLALGQREEARRSTDAARAVLRDLGKLGKEEARALCALASAYGALGDEAEALKTYHEVVARALALGATDVAADALLEAADTLARSGVQEPALELMYLVRDLSEDGSPARVAAEAALAEAGKTLPAHAHAAAKDRARTTDLRAVVGADSRRYFSVSGGTAATSGR